jgi:hypothetical protein
MGTRRKRQRRDRRITEPTFTIPLDKHSRTNVYVLASECDLFNMGGSEEGSIVRGPAVVIESVSPNSRDAVPYNLGSEEPWDWLGKLACVGAWALVNKEVAPLLPENYVEMSPRFKGTTLKQRQGMAERLPKRAKRPN